MRFHVEETGVRFPFTLWPGRFPRALWFSLAVRPVVACVMAPPFACRQLLPMEIPLVSLSPDCTAYSKVSGAVPEADT